ncbi:MAG: LrgB family protein [Clostridia bacterium]|nr:LrgB family protein [Clostridia bacterium]
MHEFITNSMFFSVFLTLGAYCIGLMLQKKLKHVLANPLLIAIIITSAVLLLLDIDYTSYKANTSFISFLLTPATVCLAIPLYEQFELLKKNWKAVICGIASGILTCLVSVFIMAFLFKLDHATYVTLLPKSITTAIGIGVTEELGGYVPITVAAIILSGILGNMFAPAFCMLCGITEPIAKGVAIGTSSHAIGTTKALELGEIEGAMSSLSIVVAGLLTVIGAPIFANFI